MLPFPLGVLLASPLGWRLALLGAMVAAFLAVAGWLWVERHWRQAAEARAEAAEAEVDARGRAIAALEQAAADAAARHAKSEPIRRAIANAPASNACADSAAMRAVLDGLRAAQGSGAR